MNKITFIHEDLEIGKKLIIRNNEYNIIIIKKIIYKFFYCVYK